MLAIRKTDNKKTCEASVTEHTNLARLLIWNWLSRGVPQNPLTVP
jgi:hypothetical protein